MVGTLTGEEGMKMHCAKDIGDYIGCFFSSPAGRLFLARSQHPPPSPRIEDPRVFCSIQLVKIPSGGLLFGGGSSIWVRCVKEEISFTPSVCGVKMYLNGTYVCKMCPKSVLISWFVTNIFQICHDFLHFSLQETFGGRYRLGPFSLHRGGASIWGYTYWGVFYSGIRFML